MTFNGETYCPALDEQRLTSQLERVRHFMMDGRWHTLAEIVAACGGTDASVSARLRDLRKPRWSSHQVDRRRVIAGLYEYRVIPPVGTQQLSLL